MAETVRERVSWDRIRYASVWEDADVLCEALAPVAPGGRLLSVASAGDNALALLTLNPAEVVAVDLSAAQLACVELRIMAFRQLEDNILLPFLGAGTSPDRTATYARLRPELSPDARAFWDAHPEAIRKGVIHAGRFERYLRAFGRWVLPLVHTPGTIRALRKARTSEEQRSFYRDHWDTVRWRLLFRLFFSRAVMGRLGRDPAFFAHVEGSVGDRILGRTRHALSEIPTRPNPYLAYILTGTFPPEALPRYLRPEHRQAVRARLDRVRLVRGAVDEVGDGWNGYNLSDVGEYMAEPEWERVYQRLVKAARPGARLVYWNMLAPRACPPGERGRVRSLDGLARQLHARDQAWFYSALHVDEVQG